MSVPHHVPDGLSELDRWGLWRMEGTKVPYRTNGRRADSTNPAHWGELVRAQKALRKGGYDGLGFAFFRDDGLVGIDLDDALDGDRNCKPWAWGIVERFYDTYMEISPSHKGLKIWCRGSLLPANLPTVQVQGGGGVEIYDHGRYFTFTGCRFRGAPLQIEEHGGDVLDLYNALTAGRKTTWKLQPLEGGRIPYGQQHSTLVSIAGTLRARRVCDEAILACLLAINENQCERPGAEDNIRRIVSSTRNWGAA